MDPAFADDWNTPHIHKALACLPRPDARFQSRVKGSKLGGSPEPFDVDTPMQMSDHEEWRPAPEMETYEVSSIGRVRRSPSAHPAINTHPGRVLRPDCATGYERVTLRHKGKQHRMLVHRLVARAFLENARAFAHVNHKDGNKMNNRVDNLEWCSPQQNVHHAWKTGLCRGLYGERNGHTKLTDRDVQVIMSARERGVHLHVIAQVYGVSEAAISCVVTGKTHNHPTNTPHART